MFPSSKHLWIPSRTLEASAGELGQPLPEDDQSIMPPSWLVMFFSWLLGIPMGLSFASMAGALEMDAPAARGIGIPCFAALLGVGFAFMSGLGMQLSAYRAAQASYLGRSRRECTSAIAVAVAVFIAIAALHGVVDFHGLLKLVEIQELRESLGVSNSRPGGTDTWLAVGSLVLVVPSLICYSCLGSLKARVLVKNRVLASLERDRNIQLAAHFGRPEVQALHEAAGEVRRIQAELSRSEKRSAATTSRLKAEIQRLESTRKPIHLRLSEESVRRIQDAIDQVVGNQSKADRYMELVRQMIRGDRRMGGI